jgi:predicted amino acid-binding ACT domain protein
MAVTVRKINLWRREASDAPGVAASTLEPLAKAGADLKLVMGYRTHDGRAAVEVWPVAGKKGAAAAGTTGLAAATIPVVLVSGDDRPGLGHAFAKAVADAGINLAFLMAQVVGRKFSAVFGFGSETDAKAALPLLRKAGRPAKKPRR